MPDFLANHKMPNQENDTSQIQEELDNFTIFFHTYPFLSSPASLLGLIYPSSVPLNFGLKLESLKDTPRGNSESSEWGRTVDSLGASVHTSSPGSKPCSPFSAWVRACHRPQTEEFKSPSWNSRHQCRDGFLEQFDPSSFKESALRKQLFCTWDLTHYWKTARINWFLWPLRKTAFMMPSFLEEVYLKQGWWHLIS